MQLTRLLLLLFLCTSTQALFAQKRTVKGYVRDAGNGETLIGAAVYVQGTSTGTTTNEYGFYSLSLEQGEYTIACTYLGYQDFTKVVSLSENQTLDIELAEEGTLLEEVVVVAEEEDQNVTELQMSVERLDIGTIQKIPALLGEVDVIRSIQLLPGVTSVGEGAAGFNVRGGSIDQNLVILDEAPVYNSSHLFGFFSVFNPDAVKNVELYKGGIPARYGGRLSSILDVRMKEGNSKQFAMQGGIGTIFSRLSVEAPIVKDKASFIVAGRRSYIDVLAQPFLSDDLDGTALNFYDLTVKTNYRTGEKDQFFLSGYLGRDNFRFGDDAGFSWGNSTATFRWNHLFSDRLFSNLTAYYSNYDYSILFGDDPDEDSFDWESNIRNISIKPEFSFFINPSNILRFGGQSIYYIFEPANAVAVSDGETTDISITNQYALESGLFVENEIEFLERFKVNYGVRLSHFAYLGGRNEYIFGEADPGDERQLTDAIPRERSEVIEDYINLEPRLAFQMSLNNNNSVKFSYNRMAQYIHLLSNTAASIPLDIWTPSTNNISPQIANQFAIGYFQNFRNDMYEFSAETYYKDFDDVVDYIDGADLILNEFVEGSILRGDGRAYGLELQMKKTKGKLSGFASYTLARTERQVLGINNNEWYPSRFDQTHNLNLTGFYELSYRTTLSATFVYNTGTPVSVASAGYYQQGFFVPHNQSDARNNFRIPDYHRLDISLTLDPKRSKQDRRFQGQWVFGIYNVYNRRNAFTVYGDQDDVFQMSGEPVNTEAVRFSVVGNFIPSISYNFKFK